MLTEIMYRLFLASLGYAKDIDLAELEIALEAEGRLEEFEEDLQGAARKGWDEQKGMTIFALNEASAVLHKLNPKTYPMADSWSKGRPKMDITPGRLADRIVELMKRRKPGHSLMFVVDEVGQFVARDTQKMLDLQGIVQQLGVKGPRQILDRRDLAGAAQRGRERPGRSPDRTAEADGPLPAAGPSGTVGHLGSDQPARPEEDVCGGNGPRQALRRQPRSARPQLADHRGRHVAGAVPRELCRSLSALLPYQIELIIDIVSGLRMQGGASKHVGGANRTIIKLAQQLLINPATKVSEAPIGTLIRLDQVYDLIEGNIGSDIRAKIISIPSKVTASAGAGRRQGGLPAAVRQDRPPHRRRISLQRSSIASMPIPG